MTKRRVIVALAAAAVLAVAGGLAWRWWHQPVADVLLASGTIEATETDVSFKISGRVIERTVDEGDRVRPGQLIARLEGAELVAETDRLRASLAASQTRLPQLETEIAWRDELMKRDVERARAVLAGREERLAELRAGSRPEEIAEAEAAVANRRERLAELKAGSRPQEIQRAEAEVREAKASLDKAEQDFKRYDELYHRKLVAAMERDVYRTAFEVAAQRHRSALERRNLVKEGARAEEIRAAEAEVRQALARLALVRQGPRAEEITRAAADVQEARAMLRRAEAGELEVTHTRQRLATLQADIARDRAALAAAEAQLSYTLLRSPQAGVVLRKHVEPGEMIAAGTPVVTVADLESIWLKIYVPEPQLGRVKLGQATEITTDSYAGTIYRGRVTFINSEAEFTPKNVQTPEERVKLVFAVKVTVGNPNQELKPGMPADARILLNER